MVDAESKEAVPETITVAQALAAPSAPPEAEDFIEVGGKRYVLEQPAAPAPTPRPKTESKPPQDEFDALGDHLAWTIHCASPSPARP